MRLNCLCIAAWLLMVTSHLCGQPYQVVIKGGHVIDPKNNIDGFRDVAINADTIALISVDIKKEEGRQVIDATGLYIVPGLIDLHAHNFFGTLDHHYLSNGYEAISPDGFTFRCGVTTTVDAGGAGWRNFETFKEQVIRHSKTRVLSFLNIVGEGMRGGVYEQNLNDMDAKLTSIVARQNKDIVGIKVAHYSGDEWEPVDRAIEAAKKARIPVMVDFGSSLPPLSLEELVLNRLRSGDIFTHAYASVSGRVPLVNNEGVILPFIWEAQRKGIIFDVGHGGSSFLFAQAASAMKLGFFPNTISTDIHAMSINGAMKDLNNVMSKFLNLGMPFQQVIKSVTWAPAQVIQRTDLGHLSPGAIADVALFRIREGRFGFVDTGGYRLDGTQKIECELTIRAGKIEYDLNGISRPVWVQKK